MHTVVGENLAAHVDHLAAEEPLEIRVVTTVDGVRAERVVAVTMRTPGADDTDLGLGFLFTEGLLQTVAQVAQVKQPEPSVITITLVPEVVITLAAVERNFFTTSACGVCGKSSLAAIYTVAASALRTGPQVSASLVHLLPGKLRAAQPIFRDTGGLHAAGLFDAQGTLLATREDVGRHNAVDKLLGAQLRLGKLPATSSIICVSGRASFELVQKARMASIPIFVAVGAPSSLAVNLARDCGMTLIGFARDQRFNIYSAPERLREFAPPTTEPPLIRIRKAREIR